MPVVYYALDHEFAPASGSNVNVSPYYSYFDYPPNSTANLVISANDGDGDPSLFELGDVYDLSWTGHGGGGSMDDAVVIRSDYLGPGEGAIVFEGINDTTGELYQVVWTPGFDLESWYWDNGGGPSSPNAFWTSDQDPGSTVQYVCFAAGTRIATPDGLRPVEDLRPGAPVSTRDHGAQPVVWAGARRLPGRGASAPVVFDAGALGNHRALALSQTHRVLIAAPQAELYFGTPEVFVPARALVNHRSIRIEQRREVAYHHILFGGHEVVMAEGLACESLFLGAVSAGRLGETGDAAAHYPDLARLPKPPPMQVARPAPAFVEARLLAHDLGIASPRPARPVQPTLIAA